jgi:uncharacterized protein
MEYREQGVRVGPSPHGLGVFSLRSFAVHEVVGPITGAVILDAKYQSDYCMELSDRLAIEPAPPFRYLNHSCHPNCALIEIESEDGSGAPQLWLEVEADIAPGEHMTIDYAWPAWAATACQCGAPDCRHWIVAENEVEQVVAKHAADNREP